MLAFRYYVFLLLGYIKGTFYGNKYIFVKIDRFSPRLQLVRIWENTLPDALYVPDSFPLKVTPVGDGNQIHDGNIHRQCI